MVESLISDKTCTSLIDRFPYASRLGSNDVPSDDETAEIKAFLREPTEQLEEIEAEISSLEARLDSLRAKHASLKSQVDKCRSLITIPRRLPADILLEIFCHCLPETCNPMMNGNTAPLSLTAVCRRWRILAHEEPKLWSAIHIQIEHVRTSWFSHEAAKERREREAAHRPLYSILSDWLARSGTRPLTFSFFVDSDGEDKDGLSTFVANYLTPFLPSISRLKSFFFEGDIHSQIFPLLTIPTSHYQSLESLFLDLEDTPADFPYSIPMLDAPILRKVFIRKTHLELTELALPWARLTHLDLGAKTPGANSAPSVAQLSKVLSLCTSLIYCGVDIGYTPSSVQPMYLPKLRRISMRQPNGHGDSEFSSAFCQMLQAPSLQHISLGRFYGPSFLALLSRHGQHVQSLDIDDQRIDATTLADGLRYCPSLLSLSITRSFGTIEKTLRINDDFFSIFTGSSSGADPLCPLLKELTFEYVDCETLTGLVSFLETKQNGDPRILSPLVMLALFSIEQNHKHSPDDSAYMDENHRHFIDDILDRELKPFTDAGLRLQMYIESERMLMNSRYGSSDIQYSDCWRD